MNNDHANVAVLPPLPYLLIVVAGVLLHLLWEPIRWFPEAWIGHASGWPLVVAAVLLAFWALWTMRSAGENPSVHKPTGAIVATGPYAFTRNPMYLQMVLVCVGFAVILWNVWVLALTPLGAWLLQRLAILPEEAYLERKFGDTYLAYKRRVRRWL